MHFITGTSSTLPPAVMTAIGHYRHKVFVEHLGWKLNCTDGLEYDQFDRDDTVYVVARNDDDHIIGTARLLSTTRPYLLSEVFPELLSGETPPNSQTVLELSRFAAMDFDVRNKKAASQFSSDIAIDLMRETLASAAGQGANKLITVSPLGVERLLRNVGIHASRAGKVTHSDGKKIFASWITVA
ncbi:MULTISPECIES: acyl-homoserine-lactone synthase [Pseudomonas]|uniref:acyl-homoserine-lactone synthase n=1 Tax=Pseudomonas TaxID=286 RepID=UPI001F11E80A|nr:acyl-homoserine-lactone synthase [Pseudomonas sp. 34 E 7]